MYNDKKKERNGGHSDTSGSEAILQNHESQHPIRVFNGNVPFMKPQTELWWNCHS